MSNYLNLETDSEKFPKVFQKFRYKRFLSNFGKIQEVLSRRPVRYATKIFQKIRESKSFQAVHMSIMKLV